MLLDISFPIAFFLSLLSTHTFSKRIGWKSVKKSSFCCCRFPFLSPNRRLTFPLREKFPSFSLAEIFAWLNFSRPVGVPHCVATQLFNLVIFNSFLFSLDANAAVAELKVMSCSYQKSHNWMSFRARFGDRLNRATASVELKMTGKLPSAFSRVPHAHSWASYCFHFPIFHTHTIACQALPYLSWTNKSMSSHWGSLEWCSLTQRMLHSRTVFCFTFTLHPFPLCSQFT